MSALISMMKKGNMTQKNKKQLMVMATTDMFFSTAQASELVSVFAESNSPTSKRKAEAQARAAAAAASAGREGATSAGAGAGAGAGAKSGAAGAGKAKVSQKAADAKLDAVYSLLPRLVDPENSRDLINEHLDESAQQKLASVPCGC